MDCNLAVYKRSNSLLKSANFEPHCQLKVRLFIDNTEKQIVSTVLSITEYMCWFESNCQRVI